MKAETSQGRRTPSSEHPGNEGVTDSAASTGGTGPAEEPRQARALAQEGEAPVPSAPPSSAGPDENPPALPLSAPIPTPLPAARRQPRRGFRLTVPRIGLDDRAGRAILAIVLAVLLWFYVTSLENPAQTTVFNALPIEVRGLQSGLKLTNTLPTVDATVQAPQSAMAVLRQGDIRAYIDLTGLGAGVRSVPVRVQASEDPAGGLSVRLSPPEVQVQIEEEVSRDFPVTAQVTGEPGFGYRIQSTQVDPKQVRVTGLREAVNRIAQVVVRVEIDGKTSNQQGSRTPIALDSSGNEVTGLTFDPSSVQVSVPIASFLRYKPVPIHVLLRGQPASGYSVSAITVDPTDVTICCTPSAVEPVQFLDTLPIGITNTTTTVLTTTQVVLPADVELYPGQKKEITVSVAVEPLTTRLQLSVVPMLAGLSGGDTAILSPDKLDVVLSGTFERLQGLTPTDIRATLDLSGKGPGIYEVVPSIIVPSGVKLESSSPAMVSVTVLTPTPLPTSTTRPVETPTRQPSRTVAPPLATATQPPTATPRPSVTPRPTLRPTAPPTTQPTAQSASATPEAPTPTYTVSPAR